MNVERRAASILVVLLVAACGGTASSSPPPSPILLPSTARPPVTASPSTGAVIPPEAPSAAPTPSPERTSAPTAPTAAPTLSPERTSAPTAAPATPATDARWVRVGTVHAPPQEWLKGVVGFRGGYVAIDGTSTVQFSPDGVAWTKVRLPPGDAVSSSANGIASDGERVLVVGGSRPCAQEAARCREVPMSWISDDGRAWRGSGGWAGPAIPAAFSAAPFWAVWAVPTGGWDATQVFATEEPVVGPAVWHSDDGRAWSLLSPRPPEPTGAGDPYWSAEWFVGLANDEGRRVARRLAHECEDGGNILSTSADGVRWKRLDAFPGTCQTVSGHLAPIGTGSWVFVGEAESETGRGVPEPMAWLSEDLVEWRSTPLALPPELSAIVNDGVFTIGHGDAGYVATGYVAPTTGDPRALTWLSGDGMTWIAADAGSTTSDSPVWHLADGPEGLLGFGPEHQLSGLAEDESTFGVWRLVAIR